MRFTTRCDIGRKAAQTRIFHDAYITPPHDGDIESWSKLFSVAGIDRRGAEDEHATGNERTRPGTESDGFLENPVLLLRQC